MDQARFHYNRHDDAESDEIESSDMPMISISMVDWRTSP